MTKRMFQVLDEMNQMDCIDSKRRVAISNNIISVEMVKAGGKVTMGVDETARHDLTRTAVGRGSKIAILMVVDIDVYHQLEKGIDQDIKNQLIDEQQQIEKDAAENFGGI